MPRLLSLRPGALITGVDLGAMTWRLTFDTVPWENGACFALSHLHIPGTPTYQRFDPQSQQMVTTASITDTKVALARIPMAFAQGPDGLSGMARVAHAANESETLEICLKRAVEALELFRNSPRVKAEEVKVAGERISTLVTIAWGIQEWIAQGSPARQEWNIPDTRIIGLP